MGLKKTAILVFLSAVFLWAGQAWAFSISPTRTLITADPGTSQTVSVTINNNGTNYSAFIFKVLGAVEDEKGRPVFGTGIEVAENWVVSLGDGKFLVKIPKDAAPGSHYLGLAVIPTAETRGKISLNTQLVSLLTIQVSGVVHEAVSINNWKVEKKLAENGWVFELGLVNNGNIEVPLSGSVVIKDFRGVKVFSSDINLGNKLLAGSSRNLKPEIGAGSGVVWPGLYKVQVNVTYGKTGQLVSAVYDLWYFPWWSQALFVVLILAFFILLRFLSIRKKNRQL
ncbi:MAG: hypothetical protein WC526_00470 [Patescibacteria group bacterium]